MPLVANANIQQLNKYFDAVLPITSKTPIQAQISIAIRALAKHTHLLRAGRGREVVQNRAGFERGARAA